MVLFDRSWYNRAGVERVMGFASPGEYEQFMAQVPLFERMLVESGIHLSKYWFSVTASEQRTRFIIRQVDPVRRWKLSPMDLQSLDKWDAYTEAKEAMFLRTDTDHAPWTSVKSNDKKRARLNTMRHFLSQFDYEDKDSTWSAIRIRSSSSGASTPSETERKEPAAGRGLREYSVNCRRKASNRTARGAVAEAPSSGERGHAGTGTGGRHRSRLRLHQRFP